MTFEELEYGDIFISLSSNLTFLKVYREYTDYLTMNYINGQKEPFELNAVYLESKFIGMPCFIDSSTKVEKI
jgi:hypothetical protein